MINLLGSTVVVPLPNPFLSSPMNSSSNSDGITYLIHSGQFPGRGHSEPEIPDISVVYLSITMKPVSSDSSQKVATRTYQN